MLKMLVKGTDNYLQVNFKKSKRILALYSDVKNLKYNCKLQENNLESTLEKYTAVYF